MSDIVAPITSRLDALRSNETGRSNFTLTRNGKYAVLQLDRPVNMGRFYTYVTQPDLCLCVVRLSFCSEVVICFGTMCTVYTDRIEVETKIMERPFGLKEKINGQLDFILKLIDASEAGLLPRAEH